MPTKKVASIAFTGAAAVVAAGVAAGPAHAATTYHIKNNGAGYHGKIKGKNTTAGKLVSKSGATLNCAAGKLTASGSAPKSTVSGTGLVTVGTLTKITTKSCSIGGIPFTATLNKAATVGISTANATSAKGKITGVSAKLVCGSASSGHAKITGSLPGSYINASHKLVADKAKAYDLTVASATGCGTLKAGKTAYLSGTATISSPTKLTIS